MEMFSWRRRAAERCGRDPGAGGQETLQRVVPLSAGPPLAVVKGFEGSCPHAAFRAEAVGAEQWFLWLQAALGT